LVNGQTKQKQSAGEVANQIISIRMVYPSGQVARLNILENQLLTLTFPDKSLTLNPIIVNHATKQVELLFIQMQTDANGKSIREIQTLHLSPNVSRSIGNASFTFELLKVKDSAQNNRPAKSIRVFPPPERLCCIIDSSGQAYCFDDPACTGGDDEDDDGDCDDPYEDNDTDCNNL
jgi:hypothetical protein